MRECRRIKRHIWDAQTKRQSETERTACGGDNDEFIWSMLALPAEVNDAIFGPPLFQLASLPYLFFVEMEWQADRRSGSQRHISPPTGLEAYIALRLALTVWWFPRLNRRQVRSLCNLDSESSCRNIGAGTDPTVGSCFWLWSEASYLKNKAQQANDASMGI